MLWMGVYIYLHLHLHIIIHEKRNIYDNTIKELVHKKLHKGTGYKYDLNGNLIDSNGQLIPLDKYVIEELPAIPAVDGPNKGLRLIQQENRRRVKKKVYKLKPKEKSGWNPWWLIGGLLLGGFIGGIIADAVLGHQTVPDGYEVVEEEAEVEEISYKKVWVDQNGQYVKDYTPGEILEYTNEPTLEKDYVTPDMIPRLDNEEIDPKANRGPRERLPEFHFNERFSTFDDDVEWFYRKYTEVSDNSDYKYFKEAADTLFIGYENNKKNANIIIDGTPIRDQYIAARASRSNIDYYPAIKRDYYYRQNFDNRHINSTGEIDDEPSTHFSITTSPIDYLLEALIPDEGSGLYVENSELDTTMIKIRNNTIRNTLMDNRLDKKYKLLIASDMGNNPGRSLIGYRAITPLIMDKNNPWQLGSNDPTSKRRVYNFMKYLNMPRKDNVLKENLNNTIHKDGYKPMLDFLGSSNGYLRNLEGEFDIVPKTGNYPDVNAPDEWMQGEKGLWRLMFKDYFQNGDDRNSKLLELTNMLLDIVNKPEVRSEEKYKGLYEYRLFVNDPDYLTKFKQKIEESIKFNMNDPLETYKAVELYRSYMSTRYTLTAQPRVAKIGDNDLLIDRKNVITDEYKNMKLYKDLFNETISDSDAVWDKYYFSTILLMHNINISNGKAFESNEYEQDGPSHPITGNLTNSRQSYHHDKGRYNTYTTGTFSDYTLGDIKSAVNTFVWVLTSIFINDKIYKRTTRSDIKELFIQMEKSLNIYIEALRWYIDKYELPAIYSSYTLNPSMFYKDHKEEYTEGTDGLYVYNSYILRYKKLIREDILSALDHHDEIRGVLDIAELFRNLLNTVNYLIKKYGFVASAISGGLTKNDLRELNHRLKQIANYSIFYYNFIEPKAKKYMDTRYTFVYGKYGELGTARGDYSWYWAGTAGSAGLWTSARTYNTVAKLYWFVYMLDENSKYKKEV